MKTDTAIAEENLRLLQENPYPGRGIILGLDETGEYLVQVYWIMGRSENSRNRILSVEKGRLFTEAADPQKVRDPSLIIYNAMDEYPSVFVVSNGHQTDRVIKGMLSGHMLPAILEAWEYEPDAPNNTPRITGVSSLRQGEPLMTLSVLRKAMWNNACDRFHFQYATVGFGLGYCITTYSGDGNPLPAFTGEPNLVPMNGDAKEIADQYWATLNPDNKVALAVKFVSTKTGSSTTTIINRFDKVG